MLAVYRLCINPNPIYSTGIHFPKVSNTSNILLSSSERGRGDGTVICSSLFLWAQTSDGLEILQLLGPQTHRIYPVQSKLPAACETKGLCSVLKTCAWFVTKFPSVPTGSVNALSQSSYCHRWYFERHFLEIIHSTQHLMCLELLKAERRNKIASHSSGMFW